jgi:hypothetical protein
LISKLLPAKYREVVLPKRIVAIIPIKTLALESPQDRKSNWGQFANCCAKNQNRFKSRCPCGYQKMPSPKELV